MSTSAARLVAMPLVVLTVVLLHPPPVAAAGPSAPTLFTAGPDSGTPRPIFESRPLTGLDRTEPPAPRAPATPLAPPSAAEHQLATPTGTSSSGSGVLAPLTLSFLALQLLDVHSTLMATERGARERNPLMAPFADQPAALIGVKVGTAAAILYMSDRVGRTNRVAAIVMMAAFTSAYTTLVANNYRVAARLGR